MAIANNSLTVGGGSNKVTFSVALASDGMQKMIKTALGTPKAVTKFCTDVMAAVSATPNLRNCEPASIVTAGLQCASLNLSTSPSLGEAWIIPYGTKATFQLGKNGLVQLAIRSGQYADIDAIEIRKGEYKGRDAMTGKPKFEFIEDDALRESLPVVGYMAYFEMLNGFKKTVYFSKEKMVKWADRYSQAFSEEVYRRYEKYLETGEGLTDEELRKCSSPWYERFDSMGEKTVLIQLLKKWGMKSIDMTMAFEAEDKGTAEMEEYVVAEEQKEEEAKSDFFEGGTK